MNNINLQLSAFAIEGNFGRIRRIQEKLREKYSTSFIPTFVIDNIFKCKEDGNLLQILREVLKYRIEPKINNYIKTIYSSVTTRVHIIREFNNYIDRFESSDVPTGEPSALPTGEPSGQPSVLSYS